MLPENHTVEVLDVYTVNQIVCCGYGGCKWNRGYYVCSDDLDAVIQNVVWVDVEVKISHKKIGVGSSFLHYSFPNMNQ